MNWYLKDTRGKVGYDPKHRFEAVFVEDNGPSNIKQYTQEQIEEVVHQQLESIGWRRRMLKNVNDVLCGHLTLDEYEEAVKEQVIEDVVICLAALDR